MPAEQTPKLKSSGLASSPDSMNALFEDLDSRKLQQKKSIGASLEPSVPARRKIIDRRDREAAKKIAPKDERREGDRRQKKPQSKTVAEKKSEQDELKLQQHRKKILLAGCEPVMGFNYDFLAMDDYPENALVAAARRDRDYWLAICGVLTSVFVFGLMGFVPAGIAGVSCGLTFISAIFAFSSFRRHFFSRPHLHVLLAKRKEIEFRALSHIRLLEGTDGLAWRCEKLKKYNSNLGQKIFHGIYRFSKEKQLLKVIRQKKHIRLYLMLMIEAQKAYKKLEKDYLENHFKHLEAGWDDRIDEQEASKLEQVLNASGQQPRAE